jgi:heat shock protein HslJ
MIRRRAAETFARADLDHDGEISRDEFIAWGRAHPATDAFGARVRQPVCIFKPPGPDDDVILVGAGLGDQPAASPAEVEVNVEPGTRPVYITLVSTEPVHWRLTGDTDRIAWINLLTKPLAGVVRDRVRTFETGDDCVPDPAQGPAVLKTARADLAKLLTRAAPRYFQLGEQPEILVPSGLSSPAARRPAPPSDQLTGWWRVRRVGASVVPPAQAKQTYAAFGDGRVGGRDGCNSYWGRYATKDAAVAITDLMTTTVRCRYPSDPEAMSRGGRLFELLDHAKMLRASGEHITLVASDGGSVELVRAPRGDRIQPLSREAATNVLAEPQWTVQPSDDAIRRNFSFVGRGRSATQALCAVDADGALNDCTVTWPEDPDRRLWQAVLATVRMYRLSPADAHLARGANASLLMVFDPDHEQ